MFERLTTNNCIIVSIDNPHFGNNTDCEINIMKGDKYLSCGEHENMVDWYTHDDMSGRQKWIIEKINDDFFIRTSFRRCNRNVYLGAPNDSHFVYMYTTKNDFTKWDIIKIPDTHNKYSLVFKGKKFDRSCVELVVARYKENIEWVNAYSNIVTVYNKGSVLNSSVDIIPLPNIGREGHTYLRHMSEKSKISTERNDKRYIYTQGNPFDHNETFLFAIDNYYRLKEVQPLGHVYLRHPLSNIPPLSVEREITHFTEYGLKYGVLVVDSNLRTPLFIDYGIENINELFRSRPEHKESESLSCMNYFLRESICPLIQEEDTIYFTYSALFSITHDSLRNFSKSYSIKNMMRTLLKLDDQGGEYGYILERLWLVIFGYKHEEE